MMASEQLRAARRHAREPFSEVLSDPQKTQRFLLLARGERKFIQPAANAPDIASRPSRQVLAHRSLPRVLLIVVQRTPPRNRNRE
jgi:hypothetical protein